MLLITRTFNSRGDMEYGYNLMHNLKVEQWMEAIGGELPWDVVSAIDSNHAQYERIVSMMPYVEPILDGDGNVIGCSEMDRPEMVPDVRSEIVSLTNNLQQSDYAIVKRLEPLLPTIMAMVGIHDAEDDISLVNIVEDRKMWRARINQLEDHLMGRTPVDA